MLTYIVCILLLELLDIACVIVVLDPSTLIGCWAAAFSG